MSDGVEIPVTPEMVKAGGDLLDDFTGACDIAKDLATRTYRAMAAVAPKDEHPWHFHVVPRTQFVDLENENRGWAIVARELSARIATLEAENDGLKSAMALKDAVYADRPGTLFSARKKLEERIAALESDNTALKLQLLPPAATPDPRAFPATALQPGKSDHRRLGS